MTDEFTSTQFLLDRVGDKTVSTVNLGPALVAQHGFAYETMIFSRKRDEFVNSGPFYWKTEDEARTGHNAIKHHEEMHWLYMMGAHY